MVIDIDHFKSINDMHGHAAGDAILKAFGPLLAVQLRSADFFARVGGEEFVVVLPLTPLQGGRRVAERLREVVANTPFHVGTTELRISISLGLAERRSGEGGEELQQRADEALYMAKHQGRNRVEVAEYPSAPGQLG
jgi:diguanylate cyclase